MPRVPAQPAKPRKFVRTEFHPEVEKYLNDLSDDVGVQTAYIVRLCVQQALPEVEARLRAGEEPADELKKPAKPLKTTLRKPKPTPVVSRLEAPPIAEFLETGEMPQSDLHTSQPPAQEPAEPAPSPGSGEPTQEPERPAEPVGDPQVSDPSGSSPPSSEDLFQAKLARVTKRR